MSGFFGTFIMFVVAMAWAHWLTARVAWAPRVVYAGGSVYLLALVASVFMFGRTAGNGEAMGSALSWVYLAAQVAQTAGLVTLTALGLVSIYALTRPAADDAGAS